MLLMQVFHCLTHLLHRAGDQNMCGGVLLLWKSVFWVIETLRSPPVWSEIWAGLVREMMRIRPKKEASGPKTLLIPLAILTLN